MRASDAVSQVPGYTSLYLTDRQSPLAYSVTPSLVENWNSCRPWRSGRIALRDPMADGDARFCVARR